MHASGSDVTKKIIETYMQVSMIFGYNTSGVGAPVHACLLMYLVSFD
jgi:hypothetical protein